MVKDILEFRGRYFFLSSFYRVEFEWLGVTWPSAEHAFQACKTLSSNVIDRRELERFASLPTPGDAKRVGRTVELPNRWNSLRIGYMEQVVIAKFEIPPLRQMLMATRDAKLVEGNSWGDKYWGAVWQPATGFAGTSWAEQNGRVLVGLNMLGRILMGVRDAINGH